MTRSAIGNAAAPDPYRWSAWGVALVVAVTPVALLLAVRAANPKPIPSPFEAVAAHLGVHPGVIEIGQGVFQSNCAACHGRDANGIPRLGKPLRNSEFIQTHSDEEIYRVILTGRPATDPLNTTGTPMPARAGNPELGDDRLRGVVMYLRTLQHPGEPFARLDDWAVAAASAEGGAPGQSSAPTGIGHAEFIASCSACHGANGHGVEGLGKPLDTSPFVASKTDAELIGFIKSGRPIWDAANTTGLDMPPKGGNPALSDEDLRKIVAYIRALHADG